MMANYRAAANKNPGESVTRRQLTREIADIKTLNTTDTIVFPLASRKSCKE